MMKPKTPFFSQRNLVVITVGVAVVYLSLWAGTLASHKLAQDRAVRAVKSKQEAFNRLPIEEKAIKKGEAYLVDSINLAKPNERLFLDYVQRKFDLDSTLGIAGPPIDLSEDPRTYPLEVHFLARIAYPNKLVTAVPKTPFEELTLTNVYSANCDHLALPSNYWQTIDQAVAQGGYYVTHVALALSFMKDNACSLPPDKTDLNEKVTTGLLAIMADPQTTADLRYETVAFLQLTGHYDMVKPEWIEKIASEQQPDGSWGRDKDKIHSSLLAMWALLEYTRQDTPHEPLISRPTTKP